MIKQVSDQMIEPFYPMVLSSLGNKKVEDNSEIVDYTEASFRVIKEEPITRTDLSTSSYDMLEQRTFSELEKHTLLYKDGSNKRFLIDKVKVIMKEKESLFFKDYKPEKEQKFSELLNNSTEEITSIANKSEVIEKPKVSSPFEELKKRVIDNLNNFSLQKFIDKQKEVVISLAKASQEVVDFMKNMTYHLTSLAPEQKSQNMASLKGLMFDTLA